MYNTSKGAIYHKNEVVDSNSVINTGPAGSVFFHRVFLVSASLFFFWVFYLFKKVARERMNQDGDDAYFQSACAKPKGRGPPIFHMVRIKSLERASFPCECVDVHFGGIADPTPSTDLSGEERPRSGYFQC